MGVRSSACRLASVATAGLLFSAGLTAAATTTSASPLRTLPVGASDTQPDLSVEQEINAVTLGGARWLIMGATIHNSGLQDITVTGMHSDFTGAGDPLGSWGCEGKVVAPGENVSCDVQYTPLNGDVAAGNVSNTLTVHGKRADLSLVAALPVTTKYAIEAEPYLDASAPTADNYRIQATGDKVTLTVQVANRGNVDIDNIGFEPFEFTGTGPFPHLDCPTTGLAAHKSMTCTGEYAVTQADIDERVLIIDVVATGTTILGDRHEVRSRPGQFDIGGRSSTLIETGPQLRLDITSAQAMTTAKETITMTLHIENNGWDDLNSVAFEGVSTSGSGVLSNVDCSGATTLAPDELRDCTVTYRPSTADIAAGEVKISAMVAARDTAGERICSPTATKKLVLGAAPDSPTSTATAGARSAAAAGDATSSGTPSRTPSRTPTAKPGSEHGQDASNEVVDADGMTRASGTATWRPTATASTASNGTLAMTGASVTGAGAAAVVLIGTGVMLLRRRASTQE